MSKPPTTIWPLCAITDDLRDGPEGLLGRSRAAERGGATMILLRLKHVDARTLTEVCRAMVTGLSIPVVVSERLDVALACGAAGVHLRNTSMPAVALRPHVPAGFLIGGSVSSGGEIAPVHASDFVTIGPALGAGVHSIGVAGFARLAAACGVPSIAIGGIDASTAGEFRAVGAAGVAAIRGLFGVTDVEGAARALREAWDASDGAAGDPVSAV